MSFIDHPPHSLWSPIRGCAWGKLIRLVTSGLHSQYTHADDWQFKFLSLGFHFHDSYSPKGRKGYKSFLTMIDPIAIILIQIFAKIRKKPDMTSQLIRSGLSDHLSIPVRAKVECCKSHDLFSCSATRIPSSSITGHHPQPTGSLIVGVPLCRGAVSIFYSPNQQGSIEIMENSFMRIWNKRNILWNNSKWSSLNQHSIANT